MRRGPMAVSLKGQGQGARVGCDPISGQDVAKILDVCRHLGVFFQYDALDTTPLPVPVMSLLGAFLPFIVADRMSPQDALPSLNHRIRMTVCHPTRKLKPRHHSRASKHHRQPLRRARNACVKPTAPMLAKGAALVEQDHIVPLRALRSWHLMAHHEGREYIISVAQEFPAGSVVEDDVAEVEIGCRDFARDPAPARRLPYSCRIVRQAAKPS